MFEKMIEAIKKKYTTLPNNSEQFSQPATDATTKHTSLIVFIIITLVLDILNFTPIYENNQMKQILNINYWLTYGIGSLGKIYGIKEALKAYNIIEDLLSSIKQVVDELKILDNKIDYMNYLTGYNSILNLKRVFGAIIFTLTISFIFDIIQFTPLMKNQYINKVSTFNSHFTVISIILLKFTLPYILSIDINGLLSIFFSRPS